MSNTGDAHHTLVSVTLSNCKAQDAERVLAHLASEFPDRAPTEQGSGPSAERPTVWTAELDVSAGKSDGASGPGSDGTIEGPVSVSAQGVPHEVTAVRESLARAYGVEDAGSASGDQELDSQFTLTPR
ncbi:hypothetical protein OKJ48_36665 [Streptomyces kunmingensis]|uniref:Uncharacterized protein n=1 Tax=Streptomyces kunmingensis TaxID=68225 RepID=A0ABU6CNQ5_9ACTN|nr:hypothetical protein [Streptomyces kunmingensis]MEB3965717.1 hypothetical protein [Streptomyces kunmingensis]